MEYLDVYLYDRKIGLLSSDNGRMEFRYAPAYLEQGKGEALSFSLPLRSEPYPEEAIIPFFANLLPDEGVRVRIAEILQVSPDNIFGLLKEIGEDCAGAVAFYSQDKSPQAIQEPLYRTLSEDEAIEMRMKQLRID